jgi:uncharacterized surface protein with fasciclin (FAS1) repeats
MFNTSFRLLPAAFALVLGVSACNNSSTNTTPAPKDITDVAIADARFTTLVAALQKADLVGTLKGSGPFTVFAPTNDAFRAAGITDLNAVTKEQLRPILLTHVLGARVAAADVQAGAATTAASNQIFLSKNSSGVFINGNSKVINADVPASNGIIHVIDNVIALPPTQNIVQIADANPNFKTLVSLVKQADLATTLSGAGPFTVFAPTDAAFTELFKTVNPASLTKQQITNILLYHVVPGRVFSTDLANGDVQTANPNGKVAVALGSNVVIKGKTSGDSRVTTANILSTNGVIHVIDKVLLP